MEAQAHGLGLLGSKPFFHDFGVHSPGGSKLRHFFEEVGLRNEEKRKTWSEVVDLNAALGDRFGNGNCVGHCERDFLNRSRSCFVDVVSTEVNWVIARKVPGAVHHEIAHDANRWTDWKNPLLLGDVLLENVGLYGAGELSPVVAASFSHGKIHGEQNPCSWVDRHGDRDLFKVDARKKVLHVFNRVN